MVLATHKSGPNYACDVAVAVIVNKGIGERRPIIMYEYKPHVETERIHLPAICEIMIQAFYSLRTCTMVLHCLTDLYTWYYFMLSRGDHQHHITITWAYLFSGSIPEHTKFLKQAVQPIFSCNEFIQLAAEIVVENHPEEDRNDPDSHE